MLRALKISRIKFGDTTLPERMIVSGGSDRRVPIIFSVFLIQTEEKNILVDAGCETMPGFTMRNFRTPMAVLEEMGIKPPEITDVILTHAHHDHIECVRYFPQANIHIQQEALEEGKAYFSENPHIHPFDSEKQVAEGVRVIHIGGHARGSCAVECETDGKTTVLCGDECYSFFNLEHRIPTASTVSKEKSRAFVEKYTRLPYVCLLCHEAGEYTGK